MRVPVVHHPAYVAPLPPSHRFPMPKFGRLFAYLGEAGLVLPDQVRRPEPAPRGWLELAHTPGYVTAVLEQRLDAEAERRLGLPVSPALALRSRCAVGGTVLAARLALEHGLACNTAGGSHHAHAAFGSGFCVFNDVAVAARTLLADGLIG
jgi:acetoin utilization deacetylase AcuC-like enzyme